MPFIAAPLTRPAFAGAPDPAAAAEAERPDFLRETVPAAFRLDNLPVNLAMRARGASGRAPEAPEPDFEALSDDNLAGYEMFARRFIDVETRAASDRIKRRIDRELADRQTLARAGLPGFAASLAAGVLDPTVLIPVGGQIAKGQSLLRITARTAAAAGVSTAAVEAGLASLQETRTIEESALNIGAATLLGGALGAALSPFLREAGPAVLTRIEGDMRMPDPAGPDPLDPYRVGPLADEAANDLDAAEALYETTMAGARAAGDLGAARTARTLTEEEGVAYLGRVADAAKIADPLLRSLTSPARAARVMAQELADTPLMLEKNRARVETVTLPDGSQQRRVVWGQPTKESAESAIKRTEARLGRALEAADDAYIRYLRGRARRPGDVLAAGAQALTRSLPEGRMSRRDFLRAVTGALRSGDAHAEPEVAAAAKAIRAELLEPFKTEAVELGLFGLRWEPGAIGADGVRGPGRYVPIDPETTTAESYAPRLYDREKITARSDEFLDRIHRHYMRRRDEAAARAEELAEAERDAVERVALLRGDLADTLRARAEAAAKGRKAVEAARRDQARAQGAAAEAQIRATEAAGDVRAAAFTELDPVELAYFNGLLRDVKRGHGDQRPVSLLQFIRAQGGVRDWNTLLPRHYAQRKNLINEKSGRPADALREMAEEQGYIEPGASVSDFADLVLQELQGMRVWSKQEAELVEYEAMLGAVRARADEAGFDLNLTTEEFAAWYKGEDFIRPTQTKKGRRPAAAWREWRALERLRDRQRTVTDAGDALDEARVLARSLRELAPEQTAEANRLRAAIAEARADRMRLQAELARAELRADMSDGELRANAERTIQRILGSPAGRLSYDGPQGARRAGPRGTNDPALSGRFKARVLDIPDREIADFLEEDLEYVLRSFHRAVAPDIELTRRFGSIDMELQFKEIAEEFDGMRRAVTREVEAGRMTQEAAETRRRSLKKQENRALRDLAAIRDRLRGTYALPEDPDSLAWRTLRTVKTLNYLRLGGGFTLSSFPDVPRVVFSNGLRNFLGVAADAFTGGLKKIRPAMEEVKAAGPGFEAVLNSRVMGMADILDDYGRYTRLERGLGAAKTQMGVVSLITPWNATMKQAAGLTTMTRVLKAAAAVKDGRIGRVDAEFLAKLGIGEETALRIAAEHGRHGTRRGVWSANTGAWTDTEAAAALHGAMRKEVDRIIVTPGQEKPLMASTGLGSIVFQFRSYNFAATQRVLLAYAQGLIGQRDAHALMALTAQIGLGMIVGALKTWQYGESVEDWEWGRWAAEGIDRSGVMSILTDVNMMTEHATRGRVGLSALAGERISRYQTRNAVGAYLGPSFGTATDMITASGAILGEGDMTEGDVRAMRRILPYQNLFYARWLFDQGEAAAAEALGVSPAQ